MKKRSEKEKDLAFLRGEFDLETRLDKRIMQVLATPRVLAYLSKFLSSDGYCIHYPPMIRFKMAGAEASKLPPHQDWPYNTHMKDFLTVWVPLVVVDEGTGGVVVYEGSHQDGNVQHVAEGSWEAKALAVTAAMRLEGMRTPVPRRIRVVFRAQAAMATKQSALSICVS